MNRIVVDQSLRDQLQSIESPVELVDASGRMLGHFVPCSAAIDNCPYTAEELKAMQAEEGGRSLPEIWRSLGAQ